MENGLGALVRDGVNHIVTSVRDGAGHGTKIDERIQRLEEILTASLSPSEREVRLKREINDLAAVLKQTQEDERKKCVQVLIRHFYKTSSTQPDKLIWKELKNSAYFKIDCETQEKQQNDRRLLINQLIAAQEKAKQSARCKPYIQLFGGVALSLQLLIGIARVIEQGNLKDPVFLWDFFYERVIREVRFAIKKNRFTLSEERLVAPPFVPHPDDEPFDLKQLDDKHRTAFIRAQMNLHRSTDVQTLKRMTQAELSKYEGASIDFLQEQLVCDLHPLLWRLEQIQEEDSANWAFIVERAQEATGILEKHGIYPLYADDGKIVGMPELRGRFAPVGPQSSILYPGLFWEKDGVLLVFGSYIGVYADNTRNSGAKGGS